MGVQDIEKYVEKRIPNARNAENNAAIFSRTITVFFSPYCSQRKLIRAYF